jgi:hypothetical protein
MGPEAISPRNIYYGNWSYPGVRGTPRGRNNIFWPPMNWDWKKIYNVISKTFNLSYLLIP